MKTKIHPFVFLFGILFSACQGPTPKPAVVATVVPSVNPLVETKVVTDKTITAVDNSQADLNKLQTKIKAEVRANIQAARNENQRNPEGDPKTLVEGELKIADNRLSDTPPDAGQLLDAAVRKGLLEQGKAEEARKAFEKAAEEAQTRQGQVLLAVSARDQAIVQRNEARAAEAKAASDLAARVEADRVKTEQFIANRDAEFKVALDKEQKAFNRFLGKILVCCGVGLVILGGFIIYGGIQSGDPFKAVIKGGIFIGIGFSFFGVAWTINQPWFKYVVWGVIGLFVIAAILYVWAELKEAQDKKDLLQREKEADEAESALKKIGTVIDPLDKDHPQKVALRGLMNSNEKALINELKAEDQRAKAIAA